jgi:hypothetical protein
VPAADPFEGFVEGVCLEFLDLFEDDDVGFEPLEPVEVGVGVVAFGEEADFGAVVEGEGPLGGALAEVSDAGVWQEFAEGGPGGGL